MPNLKNFAILCCGAALMAACQAESPSSATTQSADASGADGSVIGSADGQSAGDDAAADSVAPDAAQDGQEADAAVADDVPADPPCPSGQHWTGGTLESPLMQPGVACIACHTKMGGPSFAIAGTVYPTLTAENQCNGSGAITVEIKGKDGYVTSLKTNSAGNFYLLKKASKVVFPFTATVISANGSLEMKSEQSSGDCNHCHTSSGANGTAGRIVAL